MHSRIALALATSLSIASSLAHAQDRPDATVRPLAAGLVNPHGGAGASPLARHVSGDFVFAAGGVLRTDPEGHTRWYHPDPEIIDVTTTPDGDVIGAANTPGEHPRSVRLVRYAADGTEAWTHTYHRGAIDSHTYADLTSAPNGDVILCATTSGRRSHVIVDRIDPRGVVRWSREMEVGTECHVAATDAAGDVFWGGVTNGGAQSIVEKLDPNGRSLWRTVFDGHPLVEELAIGPDGVTLAGEFEGTVDLLPGPLTASATSYGYRAFVTRLDPDGAARWAWVGRNEELVGVLRRGASTLVVQNGVVVELDESGHLRAEHVFGYPTLEGVIGAPYVSTTGGFFDAGGLLVIAGGLPTPDYYPGAQFFLFEPRAYTGPNGAILARPGW